MCPSGTLGQAGYLLALQNKAIIDGKTIEIVFIADPGAIGMADVRDILNKN